MTKDQLLNYIVGLQQEVDKLNVLGNERKKAEEALGENLEQLSKKNRYEKIISTVTRSVHRSIDLGEVIENAVDAMNKHIETAENVSIYMVEGEDAVLKSYRGYPERLIKKLNRIPRPKGFTWKTIMSGKPLHCPDVDKDPYIGLKGKQLGTKSYVSMPICYSGKAIGCINVNSIKKYAFDNEELNLLEIVASQIENAVNNAKQAEALKKSEEKLLKNLDQLTKKNRFEEIISAVTRTVHKSLDLQEVLENAVEAISKNIDVANHASIFLVEGTDAVMKVHRGFPDGFIEKIKRIPHPKGFTWNTILEEKTRYCPDVDEDTVIGPAGRKAGTKSYLSIPLKIEGNTIGCINVHSLNKDAFEEEDINLLEVVAKQIGIAIDKSKKAEALRNSEERYRALYDENPSMYFTISEEGNVLSVNQHGVDQLGYTVEELVGNSVLAVFHEEDQASVKEQLNICFENPGQIFKWEFRKVCKDQRVIWVNEIARCVWDADGNKVALIVCEDITERKKAEIQLIQSREQLRKLATRMQSIREEEITSLARWIHDDLGQLLTGLKIEISLMDKKLSSASNGGYSYPAKRMKSISGLIDTAIFRVQRISTELRSPVLDTLGLVEAIKYQSKEFESMSGIYCEVDIKTGGIAPDQKRSIAIFRVLQESLTNIARHANATRVGISMKLSGENLLLEVEDNGRGITNSEIVNPKSVGILGMEERVLVFGGDLKIRGIPKKGTIVSVILPLNNVNM